MSDEPHEDSEQDAAAADEAEAEAEVSDETGAEDDATATAEEAKEDEAQLAAGAEEGSEAREAADPRADGEDVPDPDEDADEDEDEVQAGDDGDDGPGGRPDLGDPEEDPEARAQLKRVLESLIFVSDRTVTPAQLARAVKIRVAVVRPVLQELIDEYEERGLRIVEVAGGYQFRSAAECSPWVRDWVSQKPVRLSRAQLETLALVAYRQPITRPEIDDVRGVDTGSAVRVLLDRSLIKILGRKDEPGRPLLYGTSPYFLEFFGMKSLKDLPTLREFTELSDENRALFKRKTGEAVEDAEAELAAAEEAARLEAEGEDDPGIEDEDGPEGLAAAADADADGDDEGEAGDAAERDADDDDGDDDGDGRDDADRDDDDDDPQNDDEGDDEPDEAVVEAAAEDEASAPS